MYWPIFSFFIVMIGVFTVIVILERRQIKANKVRLQILSEYAQALGLQFSNRDPWDIASSYPSMKLFQTGRFRRLSNVMYLDLPEGEGRIRIFDYQYTESGGKHSTTYHFSVCLITSRQPLASGYVLVRKEAFGDKLAGMIGFNDIDFAEYPEFSKEYYVKSPSKEFARQFLTPEMVRFIPTGQWEYKPWIEVDKNLVLVAVYACKSLPEFRALLDYGLGLVKLARGTYER